MGLDGWKCKYIGMKMLFSSIRGNGRPVFISNKLSLVMSTDCVTENIHSA